MMRHAGCRLVPPGESDLRSDFLQWRGHQVADAIMERGGRIAPPRSRDAPDPVGYHEQLAEKMNDQIKAGRDGVDALHALRQHAYLNTRIPRPECSDPAPDRRNAAARARAAPEGGLDADPDVCCRRQRSGSAHYPFVFSVLPLTSLRRAANVRGRTQGRAKL